MEANDLVKKLRRGKINRREQRLWSFAPDFKEEKAPLPSYDPEKFPKNPLAAGAFCPDGVKKSPPALYQKLARMVVPLPESDTIWQKGSEG